LVPTDNSPAHWALGLALTGCVPTVPQLHQWFEQDAIPIAMVLKTAEKVKAHYQCTRSAISLNKLGWKVGHLSDVAFGRGEPDEVPIEQLHNHFRRLLNPCNMFVVPLQWSAIAELPQMVDAIRAADAT
jgi:hypothetical protein